MAGSNIKKIWVWFFLQLLSNDFLTLFSFLCEIEKSKSKYLNEIKNELSILNVFKRRSLRYWNWQFFIYDGKMALKIDCKFL